MGLKTDKSTSNYICQCSVIKVALKKLGTGTSTEGTLLYGDSETELKPDCPRGKVMKCQLVCRCLQGNLSELGKLLMQGSFNVWTDHKKGHSKVGGTTALWMNGWMTVTTGLWLGWWIDP